MHVNCSIHLGGGDNHIVNGNYMIKVICIFVK